MNVKTIRKMLLAFPFAKEAADGSLVAWDIQPSLPLVADSGYQTGRVYAAALAYLSEAHEDSRIIGTVLSEIAWGRCRGCVVTEGFLAEAASRLTGGKSGSFGLQEFKHQIALLVNQAQVAAFSGVDALAPDRLPAGAERRAG